MGLPSRMNYSKKRRKGKEFTVNSYADNSYIPRAIRQKVIERDGDKCVFCGEGPVNSLCCIRPKSRGGKPTVNNLTICCESCRRQKGRQLPLDFLFSYYYLTEILKDPLEKGNIFENVDIRVKLFWLSGEIEEGLVHRLPDITNTGFYFRYSGGDQEIFISTAAVKKIVPIEESSKLLVIK